MPRPERLDDSAFSDEFCRFLQRWIPSVEAAELLLALAGEPLPGIEPGDAGAQHYLELFRAAGLIEVDPEGAPRYAPADAALATHVKTLTLAYKVRPVTLFRVIYARKE